MSDDASAPRRPLVGRPFAPGQSGNPSGLPRGVGEVRAAAREHTATAIATLAAICADRKASAPARVSAAVALLDRGWGKPAQPVEVDDRRPLAGVQVGLLVTALERLARPQEGDG